MDKKDILELKKRLKKDQCTFSKVCGCYVDGDKKVVTTFRETFLNLEDTELHKYLDITKKVLSGTVGNNLLELSFPIRVNESNERQNALMKLKSSQLKDDDLLEDFYQRVIDHFEYVGNFIILLFHDHYDVMRKTTDNMKLDESEEVYEYVLCAICPVSLSNAGLSYVEEVNKIKARQRDWMVDAPLTGFVFPAYIDRSSDVNKVMYYTKNAKAPHMEIMEEVLGCEARPTATIQKESFQALVKGSLEMEEGKADLIYMDVQDNLSYRLEEQKAMNLDTEPMALSQEDVADLLKESGVSEEFSVKISGTYEEYFGKDLPLAEDLIDTKVLKAKDQRKKEVHLRKQVQILEEELSQVKTAYEEEKAGVEKGEDHEKYAVILQVRPEKASMIKSMLIDGQRCIVIPVEEDEYTKVNGKEIS